MIKARFIPGNEDLSQCFEIRREVFVKEQGFAEEVEIDGKDEFAMHVLVLDEDRPIGTARLTFVDADVLRIGRVAVLPDMRRKGVGDLLIRMLLYYLQSVDCKKVILYAQEGKTAFYQKYGFVPVGEPFDEEGVMHQNMELLKENISLAHACTGCGACGKGKKQEA